MIRNAAVAGQFYPGWAGELKEMISTMTDRTAEKAEVIGIVSPHAGYVYSGPVAGAVFSRIKFSRPFVLIGPNHRGMGKPLGIATDGVWKTPLGDVPVDRELATAILKSSENLEEDSA